MALRTRSKIWKSRWTAHFQNNWDQPYIDGERVLRYTANSWRDAGSSNNDYKRLIRNNQSATSILSGEILQVYRQPIKGHVDIEFLEGYPGTGTWHPSKTQYYGFPGNISFVTLPVNTIVDLGDADAKAVKKYFKKVQECQQAMQGLVWLGELKKTLHGLRHPAESLFKAAQNDYFAALKKLKHRSPKGWTNGIAGAYLEFVYGVKPLIQDINDSYDALERLNDSPTDRRYIHAVGRVQAAVSSTNFASSPVGGRLAFYGEDTQLSEGKVRYNALYLRERSVIEGMQKHSQAAELFGLSLGQFIPTAWELLPWSFLVDYFSNVGDVLEFSFVNEESVRWCNKTTLVDHVRKSTCRPDYVTMRAQNTPGWWMRFNGGSHDVDGVLFVRQRYFQRTADRPSVPSLHLELPGSPQKWLNMAALFASANSISPQRYQGDLRRLTLRGSR